MLTLSLIIPVYNEEHHIRACLEAIAAQTVAPTEVIVVDNNCTDGTISIVKEFSFVRVISETKQGRGHARNAGFNAARGEIIGRIDADSLLQPNWVETVIGHFTQNNSLAGLTGLGITPFIPLTVMPKNTFMTRSYYWYVHAYFGTITMWGANMAVRKSAWHQVKELVCLDDAQVHEDQDIALHMAGKSMLIQQMNDVLVVSLNQSFRYLPKMLYYARLAGYTRRFHRKLGNIPVPQSIRISLMRRLGSLLYSLPASIYALIVGVLFLPLDFIMVTIVKDKHWFD